MSLGRDTGTAGGASEWRHLNQVTWPPPPWLYQRMVAPLIVRRGFLLTHKILEDSPMVITHKLALPPGKKIREEQRVTACFSIFISLKEVQMSPQCELFKSLLRLFVCRWMDGTIPPLQGEGTPCELPVRLTASGHNGPRDRCFFSAPQSNNQKLDPDKGWRRFHPCALFVVPW